MPTRFRLPVDGFVLLLIGMVCLASVLPAHGQGAVAVGWAANIAIGLLFFLYGARLAPQAAVAGLRHWRLHTAVLLCTYALFPLLGLAMRPLAPSVIPESLYTGLLFLCLLPSTVQSSIAFTSIARGNVAAALCAASASNLLGVFLTPLLVGALMHQSGVGFSFGVLRDIVVQLLLPFVAGQLLRPLIGGLVHRYRSVLTRVDRVSILLVVYVAFSEGVVSGIWRQLDLADLGVLFAACAVLLALVLGITTFVARRVMKLPVEDEIVLVFCGSKKSLASGLPMASVLFGGATVGMAVLPLMLFHQMQLMVCAWLARRYAKRPELHPEAPRLTAEAAPAAVAVAPRAELAAVGR
ncbi:bile acid:sodium symporter [Roseomonas sp. NAR14]|uniref:Bile acid:sodium symporter n=1 Tax=Roseomonas acroporae TaxID=2937791 RepID=A0A9X2BUS2_9PROT|nr:bile acid:sodium symporter family protein [Roseomonas acroporae]MCK8785908.1 bile acid:sodium symporter [Roseomonas acroporae]